MGLPEVNPRRSVAIDQHIASLASLLGVMARVRSQQSQIWRQLGEMIQGALAHLRFSVAGEIDIKQVLPRASLHRAGFDLG